MLVLDYSINEGVDRHILKQLVTTRTSFHIVSNVWHYAVSFTFKLQYS